MKKYLTILILFFSFTASAQIIYTPMSAGGYQMKYLKTDSGFALPFRDTTIGRGVDRPGLMVINYADSLPYYYNGRFWKPVYVDSTGVIELINGKVDSVTVNGNNIFYWVAGLGYGAQLNKLDSIHVSADSIFTCIAGNCTFQYLTTAGTGTVTSIMAGFGLTGDTITTTGTIAVDTSVFHTSNWNNAAYAPIVHFHSASDIISGTLPIARGGTGLSGIGAPHQFLRVSASGTSLEYYTSSVGNADSLGGHPASYYATNTALGLKLNISDTTNKWIQDVYTRADSLFKQKNGVETFLLKAGISQSTIDSILGGYYSIGQVDSIIAQLRTEIPDVSGKVNYTDSLIKYVTPSQLTDSLRDTTKLQYPLWAFTNDSIGVRIDSLPKLEYAIAGRDTSTWDNQTIIDKQFLQDRISTVTATGITRTELQDTAAAIRADFPTGGIWGSITGTISDQTDLQSALDAKQNAITLTTTGTSGAATLSGSTLNIPQYSGGGGGSATGVDSTNTATSAGQTVFTFPYTLTSFTVSKQVMRNGVVINPSDYTVNTGNITFTGFTCDSGDRIRFIGIK